MNLLSPPWGIYNFPKKKKETNAGGMGTLEIDGAIEGNLSNRFRIKF